MCEATIAPTKPGDEVVKEARIAVETQPLNDITVIHTVQACAGAYFDRTLQSSQQMKGSNHRMEEYTGTGRRGLWTIPLESYDAVLSRIIGLRTEQRDIVVVPVNAKHLRELRGGSSSAPKQKFESMQGIPSQLAHILYPFQKAGVEFCVEKKGRALIGGELSHITHKAHAHGQSCSFQPVCDSTRTMRCDFCSYRSSLFCFVRVATKMKWA